MSKEKSRTGSARTTTGNIRTVRLNTYRERKNEVAQLEVENEQLANTIDELRLTVKNQQEQMDAQQIKLDGQEAVLYELEQAKKRLDTQPAKPVRHSRELSKVITGDIDAVGHLLDKDIEIVRESVNTEPPRQEEPMPNVKVTVQDEQQQMMSRKESTA